MSREAGREADEDGAHLGDETDVASGAHLEDVPSGAGCTEIWEKLSEQREADRREASEKASDEAASAEAEVEDAAD